MSFLSDLVSFSYVVIHLICSKIPQVGTYISIMDCPIDLLQLMSDTDATEYSWPNKFLRVADVLQSVAVD